MKSQILPQKPSFTFFLKYWALTFCFIAAMAGILYLITGKAEPVENFLKSAGLMLLAIPIASAASTTYSSRKHKLVISDVAEPSALANWATEIFQLNGMRVKSTRNQQILLEPDRKVLRAFGNWFGTELVEVSYLSNKVIVTGHYKYIDIPESKIRFGRVTAN